MAPWDGSGNFGLSDTVTANTDATADEINAILTDLANGINNALAKDGQNPLTNPLKLPSGTAINPSLTFAADLDIGFFRKGANQIGIAIGGSEVGYIDSDGLHITFAGTFSNAAIAALAALTPAADKLAYFDDVDSAALADFTAAARTLLAAADAAAQRTALGLGTAAVKNTGTSGNAVPLLDGGNTHSGVNTFSDAGGVVAKNTAKAFATFGVSGTTVSFTKANNFNIESITRTGEGAFTVAFTTALPSANYVVICAGEQEQGNSSSTGFASNRTTTGFTLKTLKSSELGETDPAVMDFVVFGL